MRDSVRDILAHVCITCRRPDDEAAPRPGALLHGALCALDAPGLKLVPVECLGNCKRPCTVSLSGPGTWTYVFGDLTPQSAPDVIVAAGLLAGSTDGLMPWRGRPEPFKRGMIARIPPHPFKDAAE